MNSHQSPSPESSEKSKFMCSKGSFEVSCRFRTGCGLFKSALLAARGILILVEHTCKSSECTSTSERARLCLRSDICLNSRGFLTEASQVGHVKTTFAFPLTMPRIFVPSKTSLKYLGRVDLSVNGKLCEREVSGGKRSQVVQHLDVSKRM